MKRGRLNEEEIRFSSEWFEAPLRYCWKYMIRWGIWRISQTTQYGDIILGRGFMSSFSSDHNIRRSIPQLLTTLGWQGTAIHECGEPLIAVAQLDTRRVVQLSSYFKSGFRQASRNLFVRQKVGELLLGAAAQLPIGMRIAVFDAWRSAELQQEILSKYVERLKQTDSTASDSQLIEKAKRYVSLPAIDPNQPAPHLTGGAVDVTLCDELGRLVCMGTEFDYFGPMAATRYFEEITPSSPAQIEGDGPLQNRRLLFNVMVNQGFTNYSEEWWHFDFGNQFWAKVNGAHAIYGPAHPHA
jgi:D-alanyl-D-alanine dipeptidase